MERQLKKYSDILLLPTFDERFKYLALHGHIGIATFGGDRIFNQMFYTSSEWKRFRNDIILRDNGCDLGCIDHPIPDGQSIVIHHLVPLTIEDLDNATEYLLNPEYVITTTHSTHMAIHYGDDSYLDSFKVVERTPNDTCPWRR